jgi:hypothetical protein
VPVIGGNAVLGTPPVKNGLDIGRIQPLQATVGGDLVQVLVQRQLWLDLTFVQNTEVLAVKDLLRL